MNIQTPLTTNRLLIEPLTLNDSDFILELVNTDGWIKFIGNRNVTLKTEATAYIQKIIDSPNTAYWVVKVKDNQITIGIITLIKRDYLEHHDIGFAFLPRFANNGYAYEATNTVLNNVIRSYNLRYILATTVPENKNSIRLLEKLGLHFEREIKSNKEKSYIYGASTDKLSIDEITKSFYGAFANTNERQPNWELLNSLCVLKIMLINKTEISHTVYNLASFIQPRQKILTDGTLTEFEEVETQEQTKIIKNIAQRYSKYQKSGILEGKLFKQKGHKFFQFVKTNEGWKISSVIWEDENE